MKQKNEWEERFNAIHAILKHARPHGLEVECIDDFVQSVSSPHFDGDYNKAANEALYEWDI